MFHKILTLFKQHKILTFIGIIAIGGGSYYFFHSTAAVAETRYVLGSVSRGTVINSVSGSGQVAVLNQVDVTPKASGVVTQVMVQEGQTVKSGDIIAQLDNRTAQNSVRDASLNLQTARIQLNKLIEPPTALSLTQAKNSLAQAERAYQLLVSPDPLTILQAQNDLASAEDSKSQTLTSLAKTYDDGFTAVSNAFVDLPNIVTGLHDALYGFNIVSSQQNIDFYRDTIALYSDQASKYRLDLSNQFDQLNSSYNQSLADFKNTSRFSPTSTVEHLITEAASTTKQVGETVKNLITFIRLYQDTLTQRNGKSDTFTINEVNTLNGYSSSISGHVSDLNSITDNLQSQKDAIVSADRSIAVKTQALNLLTGSPDPNKISAAKEQVAEAQASLDKLVAGPDQIDITSQQLSIKQRSNALADAAQTLADYTIRSPIDGVVAKVNVQKGNNASGVAASIVASQRLAIIPLNEVDVAKIKNGEKVTLTFDALPDLSISGKVAEIDTLGTVSQGVVTYNVKVAFDTQDPRVKPGMSVTGAIITDLKQDVLTIPNSAIKTRGTETYVQMPDKNEAGSVRSSTLSGVLLSQPLQEQTIVTGLANSTITEVVSGLNEGDVLITRTIVTAPKAVTPATSATSLLGGAGGNAARGLGGATGGGGNFRAGGGAAAAGR